MLEPLRAVLWNDAEGRSRAGWRLLAHAVLALALGVGALLALAPVVGIVAGLGLFVGLPDVAVFAGNQLFVAAVVVAAALVAARYVDRRELADLGLGIDRAWGRDLLFGLALGAGLQSAILVTLVAAGWATVGPGGGLAGGAGGGTGAGAGGGIAGGLPAALGFGLAAMVAVGVWEELLFRGYWLVNAAEGLRILPGVDARRAAVLAAAATSLLFGALHGTNPGATALSTALVAVYGAYLAAGYLLTGELAIPIGFHVAWNYVQGYVYGFPVSGVEVGAAVLETEPTGPDLLTGGPFGPEAGLVGLAWVLLSLPLLAWWVRRTRGEVVVRPEVAEPALRKRGPARAADAGARADPDDE